MKDVRTWLIIGLATVIVLLILFQPSKPDEGKQPYLDSIKTLKADKAIISAQIERVIETSNYKAKVSDSLLTLKEREITRLKVKASQARTPKVDTLILDNPDLKVFVEAQDSVINQQSVLIDTLKTQLQFERNVREQLVAMHYDSDKISASLQELAEQRIIGLEKDLRKKRRGVKLWKAIAVTLGIGGLLLGSSIQ